SWSSSARPSSSSCRTSRSDREAMSAAVVAATNENRGAVLAERLGLAGSLWGRSPGLRGRPPPPVGDGLFLTGTNGIHMFFMRFPIDAVFVAKPAAEGSRPALSVHRGG